MIYISKKKLKQQLYYYNADIHLFYSNNLLVMKNIIPNSIDLIFADPPYFLSRKLNTIDSNNKRYSVYKGEWDEEKTIEEKNSFNKNWIKECYRVLKDNGTIWITGSKHNIYSVGVILEECGFEILNNIVWEKSNAVYSISKRLFSFDNETILWARKKNKKGYIFNYDYLKKSNNNKEMTDVWRISVVTKKEKKHGKHPTQKPVELLERIILSSTNKNAIILDPFAGSSTTGVAAIKHNRKYIGIEKNKNFVRLSKRRLLDL